MVHPPWDQLPLDVWDSIFQRLPIVDRVHASIVSKQWSSNLKQTPRSVWTLYSKDDFVYYFDMGDGTTGKLINIHKGRIVGSSKGWLVQRKYKSNRDLFLVDPISRVQIPLPPLAGIYKIFQISSEDASQAVVAVIDCWGKHLALCKPKDKSWTIFKVADDMSIYISILFYDGILYVLGWSKYNTNQIQTHSIKLAGDYDLTLKLIPLSRSYVEHPLGEKDRSGLHDSYLVESNGELLIVLSLNQFPLFQVLKVEASNDKLFLTRSSNLDDHTLFVGLGKGSFRDESFRKNSIYLLELFTRRCRVFHLNDGWIEPSFNDAKLGCFYYWFFPNIKIGGFN